MARKFSMIEEWETYVPGIEESLDRSEYDEEDAFSVELRFLTARELKEYERMLHSITHKSQIRKAAAEYARKMFCDNVRNVRNYAPCGVDITTSDDLWNDGEPHVINDITAAMKDRSKLEEGLAKKLKSQ